MSEVQPLGPLFTMWQRTLRIRRCMEQEEAQADGHLPVEQTLLTVGAEEEVYQRSEPMNVAFSEIVCNSRKVQVNEYEYDTAAPWAWEGFEHWTDWEKGEKLFTDWYRQAF